MTSPERVRFAEAARLLGISRQRIGQWHAGGRLVTARYEGHTRHATVELRELEELVGGAAYAVAVRREQQEAERVARLNRRYSRWLRRHGLTHADFIGPPNESVIATAGASS